MRKLFRLLYPYLIYTLIGTVVFECAYVFYSISSPGEAVDQVNSRIIYLTALAAVIAGMLLLLFYKRDCRLRGKAAKGIYRVPPGMIYAAVLGAAASLLGNYLMTFLHIQELFPAYEETEAVLFGNSLLSQLLCLGICIPFAEEMVFRVLGFRRLRDDLGFLPSLFISSFLFGVYHGNMVQFFYAALLGGVIAAAYELNDSLWIPVVAHGAANMISVLSNMVPINPVFAFPLVRAAEALLAFIVMVWCLKKIRYLGEKSEGSIAKGQ